MSTRPIPKDTLNAQILASDPKLSAWVSANAGSGKTHVLTAQDQIQMWALCAYQVAARKKLRELNQATRDTGKR